MKRRIANNTRNRLESAFFGISCFFVSRINKERCPRPAPFPKITIILNLTRPRARWSASQVSAGFRTAQARIQQNVAQNEPAPASGNATTSYNDQVLRAESWL